MLVLKTKCYLSTRFVNWSLSMSSDGGKKLNPMEKCLLEQVCHVYGVRYPMVQIEM